jgi:hypothetical protein
MPIACAVVALVFLVLYEAWIQGLVTGPAIENSVDSRSARLRWVRLVFVAEAVLVVTFVGLSHALLDLDWRSNAAWGGVLSLIAAALGVVGCALALSSDLVTRRYQQIRQSGN